MPNPAVPGPSNLEHRYLRQVLEFAVATAHAGQKLRPPMPVPPAIKQYFKQHRLPTGVLGRVRRIVEADPEFRGRLAEAAGDALVDPIGLEWLRREDGWEDRVSELIERADRESAEREATQSLRREERRRAAAEETAERLRTDLRDLSERLAKRERQLDLLREQQREELTEISSVRDELARTRQEARHSQDRAEAERRRVAAIEGERDEALRRADAAEQQRDDLLVARAELAGVDLAAEQLTDLRNLASAARSLADRLAGLAAARDERREPVAVPGVIARDVRRTAEYLLGVPGVLVLIDGYNVAKLAWPELELAEQREKTLDVVDGVARRFGTEIAVVFDGADIVGSHAPRRRLSRVRYSPAGVSADDVIRAEVAGSPRRPVVVVTDDGAIRKDVSADGANLIASGTFVDVALS